MADNDVIITASLDISKIESAINKLVRAVDDKVSDAATRFEHNIGRMQIALNSLANNARTRVSEIQSSFSAMGTTFQNFATAMERAARAAGGIGNGRGGSGGTGGSGGGSGSPASGTLGELKQQIAEAKRLLDTFQQWSPALQAAVDKLARMNAELKKQTTSSFDRQIKDAMSTSRSMPNLASAENRLSKLKQAMVDLSREARRLGVPMSNIVPQDKINSLKNAIVQTIKKVKELREEASMPMTTSGVLGMGARNLNEIQAKMRAISQLRSTLPVGSSDIKTLNIEYAKLSKQQDEILGKNMRLIQSNNALGRAFRYIANRLAFTLSIGAVTSFVRQLYEVRGQYELLERSIGVLVNSFQKGTQIFNELNAMAIKSPFTLIELGTAAKQLSAYNFAADEVVDTTKRLADISAALGVPMERLVYNLGQIKAQGVLNARDARDFANAGLAIVPLLAEMYTNEKRYGDQMVTTAQVYDMMKKKLVTYHDVLKVINQVTDEGGKFFDFQAKQAGTLKVQLANLTLAWNNMLNEIGTEQQATLTKPISLLKELFKHWRDVDKIIKTVVTTLGVYKTISFMALASTNIANALYTWGSLSKAIKAATAEMALFNAISKLNPIGLAVGAITALVAYFGIFGNQMGEASQQVLMFGENASKTLNKVETLYDIMQGTDKTSSTYKKTMEELNEVLKEYGVETIKESDNINDVNKKRKEAIELIKLEAAERERANNIKKAEEQYEQQLDSLRDKLLNKLKNAKTVKVNVLGTEFVGDEQEIQNKATQIADIIAQVVASNIDEIANKTGDEYEKGLDRIFNIIQQRMKAIGISEGVITKEWLEKNFAQSATNIVQDFVNEVRIAREEQRSYNKDIEANYQAAKKATESTMTFTQKVDANAKALRNNAKDAVELYNKVMDIVKIAKQNHTISFDLVLTAQNPPKWMFDKTLPQLKQLAERFAAIAQTARGMGKVNVNGVLMTEEEVNERALQYASAAREKQYKEEQKAQEDLNKKKDKTSKKNKQHKKTSDELADALKNEISIIKKLQSEYDKLVKAGMPQQDALDLIQNTYQGTLKQLNAVMTKFKLPQLDLSIIKGKDPNSILQFFTNLRNVISDKGLNNLERLKAVDGVIEELTVSANVYNLDKITKGLNNELDKIKEEYELAVQLEANPELSGVFADLLGISQDDLDELPKDWQQMLNKMQASIDKTIGKVGFDLSENLNKANFDEWVNTVGKEMDSGMVEALNKIRESINKARLDETKKIIDEWNKLLEKYAEYETKKAEIQKRAEKERETARKHNASQEIMDAIDLKEVRELSKLDFDKFQKTAYWITATGDLSRLSNSALQMLIDKLGEYKKAAKNLDPKDINKLNNAMRKLRKEQRKNNPFSAFAISMDEAKERMEQFEPDIQELGNMIERLQKKWWEQGGWLTAEDEEKLERYIELYNELIKMQKEAGKVPFADKMKDIGKVVNAFKDFSNVFKEIADSTNDFGLKQTADAISDVIGNFEAAEKGAETWGGWWGAIIGGVTDAIPKILKWVSGNAKIDYDIQQSQIAVKKLANTYKELEHAAQQAYGVEAYGAQKTLIINKQLQLYELENQLRLEKRRKGKYQDKAAIADIEGQIIDLKNEINEATESITNGLLGITSKADFAENLVSSMIEAFKSGEDYMKVFEESFDDMVDNMIMKAIVSRLVGEWINSIWDMLDAKIAQSDRVKSAERDLAEAENKLQGFEELVKESPTATNIYLRDMWRKKYEEALAAYNDAITPTPEDIAGMRDFFEQGRDEFKNNFLAYMDAFGIKFGESAGKADLSALQQGIQGITEDTAGALEAYMNGVSQQVYYQSDIMTQIRDILVNFGGDVTIATNAQILLQLQQSFQVQMTIQNTLMGVLNASGLAFRVELTN